MGALQPWHIIVLAIVVVALFGYNKLPDVTRSVGRSLRIFKTEMKGLSEDDKVREQAEAHGQTTVAPAVTPVPVQQDLAPVAGAAPTAHPSDDEIAKAQAVLAAAAQARAEAAAAPVTPSASPNGVGSAPERADTAAH